MKEGKKGLFDVKEDPLRTKVQELVNELQNINRRLATAVRQYFERQDEWTKEVKNRVSELEQRIIEYQEKLHQAEEKIKEKEAQEKFDQDNK